VVVDAVGNNRPAIVFTLLQNVQLVTTLGAVFYFIEDIILTVVSKPLGVSVSVRPDCLFGARCVYEGVVLRNAAIVVQAKHLTMIHFQVLRILLGAPLTGAEIQIAIIVENNPASKVNFRIHDRMGLI